MYNFFSLFFLITSWIFFYSNKENHEVPPASEKELREIIITTPGLKFDPVRIKLEPGEKVRLTLENTDEMSHNLIITEPGAREEVVNLAAKLIDQQGESDFAPESDLILDYIPILKPGEKKSIIFQAPEEEGIYPYVCTFPGHGSIMYGAIYITEKDEMPELEDDPNIPSEEKQKDTHVMHKASMKKLPAMFRTFMPESGPASIAVGMPGNISYCWDAGQCRLRYAWSGGFIDLDKNWGGNGNDKAEVVGKIFYREETDFPFRIGSKKHIPTPEYLGYSLTNGYPTFKYLLDEIKVSERITPLKSESGFRRELTFSDLQVPLWFKKDDLNLEIDLDDNQGRWEGNYYKLNPAEEVKLIITVKNEGKEI